LTFYILFYFDGMQTQETVRGTKKHVSRLVSAKDARNRKVRGLWVRGERFYAQVRVPGEKSARKIPLTAQTLTEAKEELAKERTKAREGAFPRAGYRRGSLPLGGRISPPKCPASGALP
jgi:hypothetical protein